MGFLGLGEPSLGTAIIFLGAWINRDFTTPFRRYNHCNDSTDVEHKPVVGSPMANFEPPISNRQGRWRQREISLLGFCKVIDTPNTGVFQTRLLSKVLLRFPFIVEIIYWALIYGIYQMGRALLAERLNGSTVEVARHHALQVIRLEEKLHMFWEPDIQRFFLQYPGIMYWINRIYSFVHLPATITFLVGLYWFAITRNRAHATWSDPVSGPYLYESKRRTLAICNLLAFCVFSTWPCMPPRLLGDSEAAGATAESSRSYGFVDTVHGSNGALSMFNTRRWTNQLAAMPSLHFGYSLLVGLTVMQLPIAHPGRSYRLSLPLPFSKPGFEAFTVTFRTPSLAKLMCQVLGFLYPALILTVIVATANHFIMDAVAGATICLLAHRHNEFMLNFLPLEDCFLWCLRIHKPVQESVRLPKDLDLARSTRPEEEESSGDNGTRAVDIPLAPAQKESFMELVVVRGLAGSKNDSNRETTVSDRLPYGSIFGIGYLHQEYRHLLLQAEDQGVKSLV